MSKKWPFYFYFLGILVANTNTNTTQAQENTKFIFPLACTLGKDCWTVHYVDVDTAPGAFKDFTCAGKTYDEHKGTDFALSSAAQMARGVDVLAAASGTVSRVRNGESDKLKSDDELKTVQDEGKECGNGVLVEHTNGLQTIYCHLKNDSITVKPEQKIHAGQKIAQVGQSGLAAFPHLHFGIMKDGKILDPYTGLSPSQGCGQMQEALWHIGLPMKHEPVAIFDGGFRSGPPDFEAIKRGDENPEILNLNSAALTFWTGFYNVEKNDEIVMKILDPDDNTFIEQTMIQEKRRDRQFFFVGRKIGKVQLKTGIYKGISTLTRKNPSLPENLHTHTREFSVRIQ